MSSNRAELRDKFIDALKSTGKQEVTKGEIKSIMQAIGVTNVQWFTKDESNRIGRGLYRVPDAIGAPNIQSEPMPELQAQIVPILRKREDGNNRISNVTTELDISDLVPKVYKNYVPFGNFVDVLNSVGCTSKNTSFSNIVLVD